MKIAYSWLKEFIELDEPAEKIAARLTACGLEVENILDYEEIKGNLEGLVIAEVLTCKKHPDADKLSLTTVDVGKGQILPIVCGAPNVAVGQKVVVALVNTKLYPKNAEAFEIKKAKIRGEISEGMICAEDEIGLGESHEGIMVLQSDLPNGTPAAQYFQPVQDKVFEIGLTPNRADAASHWGVARDLAVLLDKSIKIPAVNKFKIYHHNYPIEVVVENTEACPRYSGVSITGVKVQESPQWLQNRLKSIGLTPINNIVDITNYVHHELGQPLHAFDADEITGKRIIVKTLPKDTKFVSLDGVERKLSEHDLMICDGEERGMCIGGVFGGIDSGISEKTEDIFLESAYFSPDYIRRTSIFHSLKTDASFRFERGTNPRETVYALKRAALLIQQIAGGEIASDVVDVYPNPIQNYEFEVTYKNINRLIGKNLAKDWIKNTLQKLEISISKESEEGFKVSVPPYRVDVQREADIIEEIARLYGYDNIEIGENLGASYLAEFPEIDAHKLQYQITQLLAANGFSEMMNNSLTKAAYASSIESLNPVNNVLILNQLSEDLGVLRQTLLFSGLEVLAYNINRKQKDLKFFEFGKVYFYSENAGNQNPLDNYKEQTRLSLFITGAKQYETWLNPQKPADFYDLASAVQKILQKLTITEFKNQEADKHIFSYGLSYLVNKKPVASLGLVQKSLLKSLDIKQEVFYAELDWDFLLSNYKADIQFKEIPKFPEVRRDLSLVLDKNITYQQIKDLALSKERNLLKDFHVFDVYEGENIGKDKKAYALSFILQDESQTLTDTLIDKVMSKLMQAFENELGAVIRK